MSTLADELLNDFEDSGSDGEADQQNEIVKDGSPVRGQNGHLPRKDGAMVLDDDDGEDEGEDEEALAQEAAGDETTRIEDEEDAKAKVEKMQLGSVSDVRNVASLMKTLEPVLEVSSTVRATPFTPGSSSVYILPVHSPDDLGYKSRKYPISKTYRPISSPNMLDLLKTTQNTTCSRSLIRSPHPSTTKSYSYISTSETTTRLGFPSLKRWFRIRLTMQSQSLSSAMDPWTISKNYRPEQTI